MRILLVGRNAQVGGGSTFRLNIGRGLLARGHEVSVAALGGPMVRRYREAGLRYYWSPPHMLLVGRLAGFIRAAGIEIVHASNTTVGDVAQAAAERAGVPFVISLHNTIADHEARHPCLKQARRIVVFDAGAAESAGKFTAEFDTTRIVRIPRPVEHQPVDVRAISPLHIAYVGRLSSRKGRVAMSLVQAFEGYAKENRGARLSILGDGSMQREVTREGARVSAASGGKVEMCGRVLDPSSVLRGAGIVVGAGYAALEAVMQGRAVIGAGFKGYGPVTEENVLGAVACNFGDTVGTWEMSPENFGFALAGFQSVWDSPQRYRFWGLDRIAAPVHGIPVVAEKLEAVYREALAA